MGQGRLPRRAHCDQVKTKGAPQRGAGRSPAAFSRHGQNDREAGVLPMPVLPNPNPMDEVHGDKMFWCKLNSRFGYGQTRILGRIQESYGGSAPKPP